MSRWPCCALVVLAASSGSALLAPAHSGALARRRAVLARRPLPNVSWSRAEVLAALAAAALAPSRPAVAVYGEFARIGTGTQDSIAAGDAKNECLFATPGTGICQVYSSGDPKIWQEPDAKAASRKLVKAAEALGGLDEQIRASRWTSISQTLGASRDLREAVGFLVAGNAPAGAAAKKVFGRTGHGRPPRAPLCRQAVVVAPGRYSRTSTASHYRCRRSRRFIIIIIPVLSGGIS